MIGVHALKTSLNRIKKKISPLGERKISVVHYDPFTGEIDWPKDEEKLNKQGVLLLPEPILDFDEWERFCASKDWPEPILDAQDTV